MTKTTTETTNQAADKLTSAKPNSFKAYAVASVVLATAGAAIVVFASVAPAAAASLTQSADAQIAVFVIPLALLMATVIFEVIRFALRHGLPRDTVANARLPRGWSPGAGEG